MSESHIAECSIAEFFIPDVPKPGDLLCWMSKWETVSLVIDVKWDAPAEMYLVSTLRLSRSEAKDMYWRQGMPCRWKRLV